MVAKTPICQVFVRNLDRAPVPGLVSKFLSVRIEIRVGPDFWNQRYIKGPNLIGPWQTLCIVIIPKQASLDPSGNQGLY